MPRADENKKDLFLRACRFEPVHRVPVWIMRQAGRYLPEYQAVRARHSFLEICKTPELAAEVSIQPFRALDVDAIIVFSDILIVAEAMGLPLDVPDSGPVLSNPIRDMAAMRRLRDFDPERDTRFVGDAIRAICKQAGPDVPVIGFAGRSLDACLLHDRRSDARRYLARKADVARRARAPARSAGANRARHHLVSEIANRSGRLRNPAFRHLGGRAHPRRIRRLRTSRYSNDFQRARQRRSQNTFRERFRRGISIAWRKPARTFSAWIAIPISPRRAANLAPHIALQGNVDPSALLGDQASIRRAAREAIAKTGGLGHILNLGHGILPTTPVANAKVFVDAGQTALVRASIPPASRSKKH